jgi:cytoskeletal protein CcmA (bactofilin family)
MGASYPYLQKDRLLASDLNLDLELSPGTVPPKSAHSNARIYKQWVDTSAAPATLRMCVVPVASPTYVAAEWASVFSINTSTKRVAFLGDVAALASYLPLTGGTLTGPLLLSGNATSGLNPVPLQQLNSSLGGYLPLSGGTLSGALTVSSGNLTVSSGTISGANISTGGTVTGGNVVSSNIFQTNVANAAAFYAPNGGFDGSTTQVNSASSTALYAPNGGVWAQSGYMNGNFQAAGLITTGTLHVTSNGNVDGNLQVNGTLASGGAASFGNGVTTTSFHATGAGNIDGGLTTAALHATGAGTIDGGLTVSNSLNVASGSLFCADYHCSGATRSNTFLSDSNSYPTSDNNCASGLPGAAWGNVYSYAFDTLSDAKLKTDINEVSPIDCLELVRRVQPKSYRHLKGTDTETQHWGFIAQDVGAAMRELGHEFGAHRVEGDREMLAYNELVAVLWGAVVELADKVKTLAEI